MYFFGAETTLKILFRLLILMQKKQSHLIPLRYSIKLKALIPLIVIIIVIVSTLSIQEYRQSEFDEHIQLMRSNFEKGGKTLTNNLVFHIEEILPSYNFPDINELLTKFVTKDKELKYAIVADKGGTKKIEAFSLKDRSLFANESEQFKNDVEKAAVRQIEKNGLSFLEFIVPVYRENEEWGSLKLGYSLESIHNATLNFQRDLKEQNSKMIVTHVMTAIVFIFIASILVFYSSIKFTQPLLRLSEEARKISAGDFQGVEIIECSTNDEMGAFTTSFNEMSKELQASYSSLEERNRELELKVKKQAHELENAFDKLDAKNTQLEQSLEQLVQANKHSLVAERATRITQELNSPIGIGVTSVSFLRSMTKNAKPHLKKSVYEDFNIKEFLQELDQSSNLAFKNLKKTAEVIHRFNRTTKDQSNDDEKQVFNLREYIEDILLDFQFHIKNNNASLLLNCPNNIIVYCHLGGFSQMITNIMMNIFTHAFDEDALERKIVINISQQDGKFTFEFNDSGKGIPKKCWKQVFEPFFTLGMKNGSGLGLYVVSHIVQKTFKGTVKCQDSLQDGTCFSIKIPEKELLLPKKTNGKGKKNKNTEPLPPQWNLRI